MHENVTLVLTTYLFRSGWILACTLLSNMNGLQVISEIIYNVLRIHMFKYFYKKIDSKYCKQFTGGKCWNPICY